MWVYAQQPVEQQSPVAQLVQQPSSQPAPEVQRQPAASQPVQVVPSPERDKVIINFDDAEVFSAIQTVFGDVLKVNYIVDPSVKGRVNFRSTAPVAKEDVLSLMGVILRLNGISIVEEGGLYRIVPIADVPREPAPVGFGRVLRMSR
jgi:general secretion pathway protein D